MLPQVIKQAKCMHYLIGTLELYNKVQVVWKIVKKETGKNSSEEGTSSIKMSNNITKSS